MQLVRSFSLPSESAFLSLQNKIYTVVQNVSVTCTGCDAGEVCPA